MKSILSPDMQAEVQLARWKEDRKLTDDATEFLLALLTRMYSVQNFNRYRSQDDETQVFVVSDEARRSLVQYLKDNSELLTTVKGYFGLR